MKSILTLLLVALLLPVLNACDSGSSGSVTVTGLVTNTFSRPLDGGTVAFGSECSATTTSTGAFSCEVETGTYDVTVTVPGYTPRTFSVAVTRDGDITVPQISGAGAIDAQVVNAVTGAALGSATMECTRLLSSGTYSAVEFSGTTTAAGQFVATGLFTGEAGCQVQVGTDIIPLQVTITNNTAGTIGATPRPASGSYRVVLSWGEAPRDLDSHLSGPDGSGGRFHVYFSNETFQQTNLDLDDTDSFGPETITLVPTGNGVYRYSVHNYSTQSAAGARGIAESPTTVRVYDATGLIRTYVAPPPTAANGGASANTWRVFEMTLSGSAATFAGATPAGMSYVTASSAGDTATF